MLLRHKIQFIQRLPKVLRSRASVRANIIGNDLRIRAGADLTDTRILRQGVYQWLRDMPELPPINGEIVLVALRNRLWHEWPLWAALQCRLRGFAPTIFYSSSIASRLYGKKFLHNWLQPAASLPDVTLIDLDTLAPTPLSTDEEAIIEDWAPVALAYDHHLEEADIASNSRFAHDIECYKRETHDYACLFKTALEALPVSVQRVIFFSGLIDQTPLMLRMIQNDTRTAVTVEGWAWRPGHLIYNINAPALEFNTQAWLKALGPWTPEREQDIRKYLSFLDGEPFEDTEWLGNFYLIQKKKVAETLPRDIAEFLQGEEPIFIMPPNVIGDSSTLRSETIFKSIREWMVQTIEWFRQHPEAKLVIRAHPAEQWIGPQCVVYLADVARVAAKGAPNVFIIPSERKFNTFSLVPFARGCLGWVSSAAVDFVIRGVPAISAGRAKYAGLGITTEPPSQKAYFEEIATLADAARASSPEAVQAAKEYLDMTFKSFTFEATSRSFWTGQNSLRHHRELPEHEKFYSILAGIEKGPV